MRAERFDPDTWPVWLCVVVVVALCAGALALLLATGGARASLLR
ncbi:MAG TPA: hypothetical protein VFC33_12765 [Acidimicrobiia bacterium]|nr:hypothetical protein [Acidimicrobiia bacterium]